MSGRLDARFLMLGAGFLILDTGKMKLILQKVECKLVNREDIFNYERV